MITKKQLEEWTNMCSEAAHGGQCWSNDNCPCAMCALGDAAHEAVPALLKEVKRLRRIIVDPHVKNLKRIVSELNARDYTVNDLDQELVDELRWFFLPVGATS